MTEIKLVLPDGSEKKYEAGITGYDIALSIGERLANDSIAIELNGKLLEL